MTIYKTDETEINLDLLIISKDRRPQHRLGIDLADILMPLPMPSGLVDPTHINSWKTQTRELARNIVENHSADEVAQAMMAAAQRYFNSKYGTNTSGGNT